MFVKKIILLAFLILVFSINVFGANVTDGYKWLNNEKPNDVFSASLGLLALKEVNGGSEYLKFLQNSKSGDGCWLSNNCKAKETALAALALSKSGINVDSSLEWLKKNQEISLTGEWLLQIETMSAGECNVEYSTSWNNSVKNKINVDKGYITSAKCNSPNTLFNFGNCFENNLLLSRASVSFDIKCDFDGKISSLYNDNGVYYLNDDVVSGGSAKIIVNNGNFGSYEDTLFVNWVLKELNYDINSLIFLRKNFKNDVKSNAFFYLITSKELYANELSNSQKEDGGFGDILDSSIALLALNNGQYQNQIELGRKYLDLKQSTDGSWDKNIATTALVLYGVYPKTGVDLGESATRINNEEETKSSANCNNDGICDKSFGENSLECKDDCSCGDKICDSSEDSFSCAEDCGTEKKTEELLCGNDNLDLGEECDGTSDEKCPGECQIDCVCKEKEKSSYGFLWFIIIILILGGAGFFLYRKFGKGLISFKFKNKPVEKRDFDFSKFETKNEKKTEFKGPLDLIKPIQTIQKERKSKVEDELEKSLKEAKRILGK